MPKTLNVLFSQPPCNVTDHEFNEWYDAHMVEILGVPKWLAAQRFRLDTNVENLDGHLPYGFAIVYEVEGDFASALAEQEKASLATYEQYIERKKVDPSGPPIPAWLPDVRFAWWNGVAVSSRIETAG